MRNEVKEKFCGVFAIDQLKDRQCQVREGRLVFRKCFLCDSSDEKFTVDTYFTIVNTDLIDKTGLHWIYIQFVGYPFNLCLIFDPFVLEFF